MDSRLESLVGTPYDEQHSCYWLVREVLKILKGIELPNLDPAALSPGNYIGTVELRGADRSETASFTFELPGATPSSRPIDILGWSFDGELLSANAELQPADILGFSKNPLGLIEHVGIVTDAGNFMHADEKCGQVVCEALSRCRHLVKAVGRIKQ